MKFKWLRRLGSAILAMLAIPAVCTGCKEQATQVVGSLSPAEITCFSGGQIVYRGKSSGRVEQMGSGGWIFVEAESGQTMRVSGTCVIRS